MEEGKGTIAKALVQKNIPLDCAQRVEKNCRLTLLRALSLTSRRLKAVFAQTDLYTTAKPTVVSMHI